MGSPRASASGIVTRFAPSPTGLLHLGHAYSALFAFEAARRAGGRFLLRIEDIDAARCREEHHEALLEDLAWLGLEWDHPPRRQSRHLADYAAALDRLEARGVVYPCFCTRREILVEVAGSASAPHGPDGPLYPGKCRALSPSEARERRERGEPFALRLAVEAAQAQAGPLVWRDREAGLQAARPDLFGDVVLARKEVPTSYHLAATLDDHLQGVTLVTRGEDLRPAVHLHRLLQAMLGLETPEYHHHRLLVDPATGRRYAKRDQSLTLRALRQSGVPPMEIRRRVGMG
ncbi:MAG: tRNA glutamyl-Q(34) synthetase GluQRS [Magnetococcales bacterium]|nr:tRNA glutamyl-Q(34) synthetase GluQRS [Magnetococcales bacterium]